MRITNTDIGYNGRLGNQIFQLASLLGLAWKHGKDPFIPSTNLERRQQHLSNGSVIQVGFDLKELFPKLLTIIEFPREIPGEFLNIFEGSFNHDKKIESLCSQERSINLHGYFQSPEYWRNKGNLEQSIKDFLDFPRKNFSEYISIHVRRGDYLSLSDHHPPCSQDYYSKAMARFPGRKFLIFSDDTEWCKGEFNGPQFEFSETNDQIEDFKMMASCEHNIIANSSFSWWASYLNKNTEKEIICPARWFGPNYAHYDTSELQSIATTLI